MTKFVRCSEYRPVFSEAVLEAIEHYRQICALRNEAQRAIRVAGLSVSANLLQIRLAKLVEAAELTGKQELLLTDLSEKLYDIKRQFRDPAEQKQAIAKLVFEGHYLDFIMEQLYSYIPKLEKMLVGDANGMPPVSKSDAEDIASTAFQNFVQNKDKASIISSLERFDPSEGSLLNWIQGGLKAATQKLVAERQQLQKQEMSMNQKIGDNDDTEMGDMLAGDTDEPDLSTYSERADRLITELANYARDLKRQIAVEQNGGERFKLEARLEHIQNPKNEVSTKLQTLKQIGDSIEDYDYDVTLAEADINDLMNSVARIQNPDPNMLEGVKAKRQALLRKLNQAKEIRQNAINEFEGIYADLRDLEKYDVETGKTLVNNEPTQAPVSPEMVAPVPAADGMTEAPIAPGIPASTPPEVQVRTKARGGRSLLSPQDEKLIMDRLEQSRNKLRPSIYEAMAYPKGKHPTTQQVMHDSTGLNLYNLDIVKRNIGTKQDLEAVISGNLEHASNDAIFADICVRGMLYARDQQAIEKAFDPEIIQTDAEILRGATEKFQQFVLNEIQNNPILVERQAEYNAKTGNLQDGANGTDPQSPQGVLITKLAEYLGKSSSFRTLFEHFDHMARGAAYQSAKKELFPDVPWENLTPENKQQIAEAVYNDQYTGGYRPMYIAKHKGEEYGSNKYEPRYPLQYDKTGDNYRGIMGRELDRIGLLRSKQSVYPDYPGANDRWYEISPNEADFKNKPKLKKQQESVDDGFNTASLLDTWIKIANAYDNIGQYVMADRMTEKIKRMAHG